MTLQEFYNRMVNKSEDSKKENQIEVSDAIRQWSLL